MLKKILSLLVFALVTLTYTHAETITIPVMVGQTGASALFGSAELDSYMLAAEEWNAKGGINGKKIKLRVEDTQTNHKTVLTAFRLIAFDKPSVILGPTWLDAFQSILKPAEENGIAIVTPSALIESFEDTDFQEFTFYYNTTLEIRKLIEYINNQGLGERIALIYQEDKFSEIVRDMIKKETKNLVSSIGVQEGETNFKSIVLKQNKLKPSVLILLVWNESSLTALMKDLKVFAPSLKLATIHDGEGWLVNKTIGQYFQQLIYTKFLINDQGFVAKYKKKYGKEPILTAPNAYDAANTVFTALASGAKTSQEIKDYLRSNEINTVTFGKVRFDSRGAIQESKVAVKTYN